MYRNLNRTIWIFTTLIICVGLLTLFSASSENVRVSQKVFYDQLMGAGLGLLLMFFISRMDYRRFFDIANIFYVVNILILIYVLVGGRHALGARRWLEIGILSFQPSEITKLSVILLLARYYSVNRPRVIRSTSWGSPGIVFRDLLFPFILIAVPMFLIFKQPDLGTAILILGIFLFMVFAAGVRYRYIIGFLVMGMVMMPVLWKFMKQYQKDRLLVFLNPNIDPLGAGYTIIQSKIAIGSGQILGKGWLAGTQNQLNFLPERHTDFIFSVIGEEWGLLGSLFLVSCYFGLIWCGFKVAEGTKDQFGSLTAMGIVGILTLQVTINIGMVMGLCPVVGITLPLMSYGRTSFILFIVLLGILLNLSRKRTIF